MKKTIILLCVILAGTRIASAGLTTNFKFTFVGPTPFDFGQGSLQATDNGDGTFLVTKASGKFDGQTINGVIPTSENLGRWATTTC